MALLLASIAELPETELAKTRLVRQVETSRAMDDHLREEYQKARMAEEVEVGRVEILDLAARPYRPVQNGVLKLSLGLRRSPRRGIALLRERGSVSIRRRADLEEVGVRVLAIIPEHSPAVVDDAACRFAAPLTAGRAPGERSGKHAAAVAGRPLPSRAGNEAYRLLHASLQWVQGTEALKTIAIASALPREGEEEPSRCNLAITFALEGRRTLLIDGRSSAPSLASRVPGSPCARTGAMPRRRCEPGRRCPDDVSIDSLNPPGRASRCQPGCRVPH